MRADEFIVSDCNRNSLQLTLSAWLWSKVCSLMWGSRTSHCHQISSSSVSSSASLLMPGGRKAPVLCIASAAWQVQHVQRTHRQYVVSLVSRKNTNYTVTFVKQLNIVTTTDNLLKHGGAEAEVQSSTQWMDSVTQYEKLWERVTFSASQFNFFFFFWFTLSFKNGIL